MVSSAFERLLLVVRGSLLLLTLVVFVEAAVAVVAQVSNLLSSSGSSEFSSLTQLISEKVNVKMTADNNNSLQKLSNLPFSNLSNILRNYWHKATNTNFPFTANSALSQIRYKGVKGY